MASLTVALMQIPAVPEDPSLHLQNGLTACHEAREQGADLALFPELWQTGYPPAGYDSPTNDLLSHSAVTQSSPFFQAFQQRAHETGMGIGLTYLESAPTGLRNTISLLGPDGRVLLNYSKVHTCAFDWEGKLQSGDGFPVVDFPLPGGSVRLGCMICMDREFPEAARMLMLNDAEILLVPNACELEQHRLHQVEARAFENMVGIAVANYPAPQQNGHSVAYSPIAFNNDEGSANMLLFEAGAEAGIHLVRFDLDAIRAYRAAEPWGAAFRHPETYGRLVSRK